MLVDHPYPGGLLLRGLLLAMLDRTDEAWAVALPAEERLREIGLSTGGEWLAEIALIAGDHEAAAAYLRDACDALETSGNLSELSTYAALLGYALCKLGRNDEADSAPDKGASSAIRTTSRRSNCGDRRRRSYTRHAESANRRNSSPTKRSTGRGGATHR